MNRQFYALPEPTELGLEWQAFEEGREKIAHIEGRRQEAAREAHDLEVRIREEQDADVRELARSILAGEDDPAAPTESLAHLELYGDGAEVDVQDLGCDGCNTLIPRAGEHVVGKV